MDPLIFAVEVARGTGHTTAAITPTREYLPEHGRETSGALAFQLAVSMLDTWPDDTVFDRRSAEVVREWATFTANTIKLRELAEF